MHVKPPRQILGEEAKCQRALTLCLADAYQSRSTGLQQAQQAVQTVELQLYVSLHTLSDYISADQGVADFTKFKAAVAAGQQRLATVKVLTEGLTPGSNLRCFLNAEIMIAFQSSLMKKRSFCSRMAMLVSAAATCMHPQDQQIAQNLSLSHHRHCNAFWNAVFQRTCTRPPVNNCHQVNAISTEGDGRCSWAMHSECMHSRTTQNHLSCCAACSNLLL